MPHPPATASPDAAGRQSWRTRRGACRPVRRDRPRVCLMRSLQMRTRLLHLRSRPAAVCHLLSLALIVGYAGYCRCRAPDHVQTQSKKRIARRFDNTAAQLGHTDFVDSVSRWPAWLETLVSTREPQAQLHRQADVLEHLCGAAPPGGGGPEIRGVPLPVQGEGQEEPGRHGHRHRCPARGLREQAHAGCIVLAVDTDFEPLLDALNDCSQRTVIAASPGIAMEVFSECANIVIPLDKLREAMAYERTRSTLEVLRDKLRVASPAVPQGQAAGARRRASRRRRPPAAEPSHRQEKGNAGPGGQAAPQAARPRRLPRVRQLRHHAGADRGPADDLVLHEYDERRRAIALRPPKPRTQPTQRTAIAGLHGRGRRGEVVSTPPGRPRERTSAQPVSTSVRSTSRPGGSSCRRGPVTISVSLGGLAAACR